MSESNNSAEGDGYTLLRSSTSKCGVFERQSCISTINCVSPLLDPLHILIYISDVFSDTQYTLPHISEHF